MGAPDRPPQRDRQPGRAHEALPVRDPGSAPRQRRPPGRVATLLPFTQLDFAGRLGLEDGRYLARARDEDEVDRVLIVQTLGAPHPESRLRRRRARAVEGPSEPEVVPVTRVTVANSVPFDGDREALEWLEATADDPDLRVAEARSAVALLNRALAAVREAAEDPLVHDVGASQALTILIGYGTGNQLVDGNWADARQLPPPPTPRRASLDPQQSVAEALSGREPAVNPKPRRRSR